MPYIDVTVANEGLRKVRQGLSPPYDNYAMGFCEAIKQMNMMPTADVVSKSEYDRLQDQVNRLKKYDEERDIALHARLIAETREKVTTEIFEEIYKTMNSVYASVQHSCVGMHGDNPETMRLLGKLDGVRQLGDEIAELKKKRTDGKGYGWK